MLLGVDDVVVRWWRDERVLDGGYCDARARGENSQRTRRIVCSRRCSYRRRLAVDAAYVRFRSFADSRRGAHALVRVTRSLPSNLRGSGYLREDAPRDSRP